MAVVVVVTVVLRATVAGAQPAPAAATPPGPNDPHAVQDLALRTSRTLQAVPGGAAGYALPVPEVTLQTTKDGTEATAVIGVSDPFWGFRTTFKTPIGKEADAEASPLSLAGLANQASVDFAVIRTRIFKRSVRERSIDDLRLDRCAAYGIPDDKCSDQAFTGAQRQEFLDFGMHAHPTIFAAHVQIGAKSFDFVERGRAAKATERFTSIAGGASYAWLFLEQQSVLSFALDAARDYAASRDQTLLCQPIATDVAGTERCDTRTIGRPTGSRKVTTTVEFRKVFSRVEQVPATPGATPTPPPIPEQSRPVVGLAIRASVLAVKDGETVWGVAMPVYFLQKKPDQTTAPALNGGAAAAWDSSSGFSARVFIGAAFALIAKGFNQ